MRFDASENKTGADCLVGPPKNSPRLCLARERFMVIKLTVITAQHLGFQMITPNSKDAK
jgi:hypothetical protein